jgi:hypothetical protein
VPTGCALGCYSARSRTKGGIPGGIVAQGEGSGKVREGSGRIKKGSGNPVSQSGV